MTPIIKQDYVSIRPIRDALKFCIALRCAHWRTQEVGDSLLRGYNLAMTNKTLQNKIIILALAVVVIILLLAVMQFTGMMDWGPVDFLLAGALLFGVGLAFVLLTNKAGSTAYRVAAGIALAGAFALVWINIAVGVIGSEDNPANRMYIGVLAILILGALAARFRPQGMARALIATALAQVLVTAIALITVENINVLVVLVLNAFFATLWVGAAVLFQYASGAQDRRLG